MKKAISTALTPANRARVLELLFETPGKLEQLSLPLSEAQLRQAPAADQRSFSEVLAHLIRCEARAAEAIYLALLTEEPLILDLHPERDWGKLLRYEHYAFAELLAYFKLRRQVLLAVLSNLSETQWARVVREEGKQRRESVYWRARSLALHELEHLDELVSRLKQ